MEIAKKGVEEARRLGVDAVIIDTAGRLQVRGGGGEGQGEGRGRGGRRGCN